MPDTTPDKIITILLVDDIPDTRENVKKLLGFERDFKVVGMAGTGAEGIALANELRPDIVIMDINMPDMDGIQATTLIVNSAPSTGVVIMSAQDDPQYMRRSMMAGAKAFITKPSSPDNLYHTIREVYKRAPSIQSSPVEVVKPRNSQARAGNIIVVYSPQGGAGCTTIATNVASDLTRDGIRVLLVDANLQFGDVGVFLNIQARSTLVDLIADGNVDDLDTDYFENIVMTHDSGLKVLLGPARPELAERILAHPAAISQILSKIRWNYDFVVVDTSLNLDEANLSLMDIATRIVLVTTSTLASIKNTRFVLDLFDQLDYSPKKVMLVVNRFWADSNMRKLAISVEKITSFLSRPVEAIIPSDEFTMLDAVRKGIPVVASQRDRTKSPTKELLGLSNSLFTTLIDANREEVPDLPTPSSKPAPKKVIEKNAVNRWGEPL